MGPLLLIPTLARAADPEAVDEALRLRDCARAVALATEWTVEWPTEATAWRRLGDARRCGNDAPNAVRAYRQAAALGDTDAEVGKLIDVQSRGLATLRVDLVGLPPGVTAVARLEARDASWPEDVGGEYVWTALPVGVPMRLFVEAPGLLGVDRAIPPLSASETRPLRVELRPRPAAGVQLLGWDTPGVRVSVAQDGAESMVMGELHAAFVGPATVRIAGRYGKAEVRVDLVEGKVPTVDVGAHTPGQLTLEGLPVGTIVRVGDRPLAGEPAGEVVFDDRIGLELQSQRYPGLSAGHYALVLDNALIGRQQVDADVAPGQSTPVKVPIDNFPRALELVGWRDGWRSATQARKRVPANVAGAGIGFVLAAGGAAAGGVLWADRNHDLGLTRDDYQAAVDVNDVETARTLYGQIGDARRARRLPVTGAVAGGAVAAGAVGLSLVWKVQFGKAHPKRIWDPAAALEVPAEE